MTDATLFDSLWTGATPMEDWTRAVAAGQLTHVTDDIVTYHSTYFCGSVTAIRTTDGLVLIDTANAATAPGMLATLRAWSDAPIHTVIYTHGHIDHTGGMATIDAEAAAAGRPSPRIVGHRAVARRLRRYIATQGFNSIVQGQQFGYPDYTYPVGQRVPDVEYDETLTLDIGGTRLELAHGRGETDDATFVWLPEQRVLASGDFVIWMFPNAGNPRKVQRYAAEWAATLRRMQSLAPATLIPGHGPVIAGPARVDELLATTAAALEHLVAETLRRMNAGASLETVLADVTARPEDLAHPWLRAAYDDPSFVVRGIWHLNAGWFDNDIARLRPPPATALAAELATLAGGAQRLMDRATTLAAEGDTSLAVALADLAAKADPTLRPARAAVLQSAAAAEPSLMAKAIFRAFE